MRRQPCPQFRVSALSDEVIEKRDLAAIAQGRLCEGFLCEGFRTAGPLTELATRAEAGRPASESHQGTKPREGSTLSADAMGIALAETAQQRRRDRGVGRQ